MCFVPASLTPPCDLINNKKEIFYEKKGGKNI